MILLKCSLFCRLTLGLSLIPSAFAQDREQIIVTGRQEESISLSKFATSVIDTPQAMTVISSEEMERRGINNLNDALRAVPGISLGAGETSWQGNNIFLRGFTTRNDTYLDGVRDFGYYFRDPFNLATIDLIKGPASSLFGRGSIGGIVNQSSKLPLMQDAAKVELSAGTDDTRRGTIDVNAKISPESALRVAAMRHVSGVAKRDGARAERWGVAPTLAFAIGARINARLSYFHQEENNRPDYGIPWLSGSPAPVDRSSFYGFDDDYLRTNVNILRGNATYDLSPTTSIEAILVHSRNRRAFRTSEAVIPSGTSLSSPLSDIVVSRNIFSGFSTDSFFQAQLNMSTSFTVAGTHHKLVTGLELGREKSTPTYIFHKGVVPTMLIDPQPQTFSEAFRYVRLRADSVSRPKGLYARDTIDFGKGWLAMLGMRWDQFSTDYSSMGYAEIGALNQTTDIRRVDRKLSYSAALIYKPSANSSIYATYGNAFSPSGEGIESLISSGRAVAQANVNAEPETGKIFEIGAKAALLGDRLLMSMAAFDIVKDNVRVPSATVMGQNANGGRQQVKGFEIELSGYINERLSIKAAYAFLDSKTVKVDDPSAAGSPRLGAPLTMAPRNSGVLQIDYRFPTGLQIGGGAIFQSSRLGQNSNATLLTAPGYTIFEARAKYPFSPSLTLQANVYNIADRVYYDQLHPFHVVPGAGRSALVTLTWKR